MNKGTAAMVAAAIFAWEAIGVVMASMKWASTYFIWVLLVGILFGTAVDIAAAELHGLFIWKLI